MLDRRALVAVRRHIERSGWHRFQTSNSDTVWIMSHPLNGCWAKIERAKEQIEYLNGETTTLLNSGAYSIGECQAERRRYTFKLMGPPVPLRISIIAGEIVHHLRSCFDHVVWALAKKNGLSDTERVNFPVCETSEKFEKAVQDGIIKGVSRSARPLIEALQPYRIADPANSVLQIIHDLDIADKHRILTVVTHNIVLGNAIFINRSNHTDPAFGIELPPAIPGEIEYPWAIEDGVEVHWIPLRGTPGSELEIKMNSSIQIAFEQIGTIKRPALIPMLINLCNYTETSLHTFDGCF
jgi:hypothetical protein